MAYAPSRILAFDFAIVHRRIKVATAIPKATKPTPIEMTSTEVIDLACRTFGPVAVAAGTTMIFPQTVPRELARKLGPDRPGFRGADLHAQHFTPAVGADRHGDDRRDRDDAATPATLRESRTLHERT